jgi:hypothetical protein
MSDRYDAGGVQFCYPQGGRHRLGDDNPAEQVWHTPAAKGYAAFQKTPQKVLTVTINEDGTLEYLKTDSCDILLELGEVVTRRASHVEPAEFWPRLAFHLIRSLVNDKSRIAQWTRNWKCFWRVNTAPVGGPILRNQWGNIAAWSRRQDAIDVEIEFLNDWFLQRPA